VRHSGDLQTDPAGPRGSDGESRDRRLPPETDLIELLFFAYRDFVGEPDRLLERHGFGRAHHRVLHFINRHPGLNVAELLDILEITKQSLARVLKDLIAGDFVEQRAGVDDRRQRRLFLTAKGQSFASALIGMQSRRIRQALDLTGPDNREAIVRFLGGLVDQDRERGKDHDGESEPAGS
jgi:DNA-binding MarR family transcriptional regulator